MIYATMCVGKKWIDTWKLAIDNFSKDHNLHILTDDIDKFKNATCYEYKRDVFSYYEKINFVLELSKKYKERITFIDTDGLDDYNTDFIFDNKTFYTAHIWKLTGEVNNASIFFSEHDWILKDTLLSEVSSEGSLEFYILEKIMSFPKMDNIDEIIKDNKVLQSIIEKTYNQNTVTRDKLKRYKSGIGYCEGWGMSTLCTKYNIPVKPYNWRKDILI